MAVAIEGVDLVLLCAVIVLLGLTLAAQYTFQKLADAINVSVVGTHPFAGVSRTLENTIVHWCAVGASALEGTANLLWRGLTWSVSATLQTIMAIPRDIHNAISWLKTHTIVDTVRAALVPINKQLVKLEAEAGAFTKELTSEVTRLDAQIKGTATATVHTLEHELTTEISRVEGVISTGLHSLKTTLEADFHHAVSGAEAAGAEAINKLRTAENAAIDAIDRAEGATAAELRDFIGKVPLTDIAAATAAIPLLIAAVNVLEAETGLGRAECRAKVKNICGTDPSQWASLLEGLILVGVAFNIEDMINAIVGVAERVVPEIESVLT
jgi:hypothetical protein